MIPVGVIQKTEEDAIVEVHIISDRLIYYLFKKRLDDFFLIEPTTVYLSMLSNLVWNINS